jgi:hypothetical protein
MIILGKPKKNNKYIHFNFEKSNELHLQGILPRYKDTNGMWFLIKDLEKNGGENIE